MISALEELNKERKKNKLLKKELIRIKESTQDSTISEEINKSSLDLKVKLEEAKMIEETLRKQIEEKEGIQVELEKEIVSLRRKLKKENIKQNLDKSIEILNQIINRQRPIHDKSGLGHSKKDEKYKVGTRTSRKHEASSSFSKDGSEVIRHDNVRSMETIRRMEQGGHQGGGPTPQERFKKDNLKMEPNSQV